MADTNSGTRVSIGQLILIPAVITLVITILRVVGELQHWSPLFFNRSAGGGGALVGISWLPIIFGPYFALKLTDAGQGSRGAGRTILYLIVSLLVFVGGAILGFSPLVKFPGQELVGLLLIAASALLLLAPWPALGKTLIAYGYAARIPVAIVMFFAMRGEWGTHYDALPPGYTGPMGFWGKYAVLALAPQLVMWIAYTVIVGGLIGTIVVAAARRKKAPAPATT